MPAKCATCGKPIRWCATQSGSRMPIDEAPHPQGNLVIEGDNCRTAKPEDAAKPRFRSHLTTCPHASQYHKRKGPPDASA